jgi:hypothetical protein
MPAESTKIDAHKSHVRRRITWHRTLPVRIRLRLNIPKLLSTVSARQRRHHQTPPIGGWRGRGASRSGSVSVVSWRAKSSAKWACCHSRQVRATTAMLAGKGPPSARGHPPGCRHRPKLQALRPARNRANLESVARAASRRQQSHRTNASAHLRARKPVSAS